MLEGKAVPMGIRAEEPARQPADTRLLRLLDHTARGRETLDVHLSIRRAPGSRAKSLILLAAGQLLAASIYLQLASTPVQDMELCTQHGSMAALLIREVGDFPGKKNHPFPPWSLLPVWVSAQLTVLLCQLGSEAYECPGLPAVG